MLPRERVFKTLKHQEPDTIPWGEHFIDYNVYEDILGRESFIYKWKDEVGDSDIVGLFVEHPGFQDLITSADEELEKLKDEDLCSTI